MSTNREALLCRYHYDPLDRLADCVPLGQENLYRFYLKTRLATEIQGAVQHSIFQKEDKLLAQQQRQGGTVKTILLATDVQRSVLTVFGTSQPHPLSYTPYGHCQPDGGLLSLLAFNGERLDSVTGHYLLGNGYRAFNPVLMRFNSPDSLSPFGRGGGNTYAYCIGDPINRDDPTGHFWQRLQSIFRSRNRLSPSARAAGNTEFRNPLAILGTLPSRQQQATTATGNLIAPPSPGFKTPAWTTRDTAAFHVQQSPVVTRHGSVSSNHSGMTGTENDQPISRSASRSSLTMEDSRARRRGAVVLDPNDSGLVELRSRHGGGSESQAPLRDLPPSYDDAQLPSYPEALLIEIRSANLSRHQDMLRCSK